MSIKGFMIVGCPRSGTTLLQQQIMNRYSIYTTVETHYFSLLNPITKLSRLLSPRCYLQYRAKKRLREITAVNVINEKNDFLHFNRVMQLAAINNKCKSWCEKTPRHLHFIDAIEAECPKIEFIHIIRNGYDVVNSLEKAMNDSKTSWLGFFRKKPSREELILRWNADIKISRKYWGKEKHHFIVYEDFLHSPKKYLENIFVDIKKNHENIKFEVIEESEVWKENNKKEEIDIGKSNVDEKFYNSDFDFATYEELRFAALLDK